MEGHPVVILIFFVYVTIFLIVLAVAIIHFAFYGTPIEFKRRKWATKKGLAYKGGLAEYDFHKNYPEFNCLSDGSEDYAIDIARGTVNNRAVTVFDYHSQGGSGEKKAKTVTTFTAVIVATGFPVKPLVIRPETTLDRVFDRAGYPDVDFESVEFSRKFFVQTPDKKWAFDIVTQSVMELLLESPPFMIEFGGNSVIAYRDARFTIQDIEDALALLDDLLQRIPDYVIQQQKMAGTK